MKFSFLDEGPGLPKPPPPLEQVPVNSPTLKKVLDSIDEFAPKIGGFFL